MQTPVDSPYCESPDDLVRTDPVRSLEALAPAAPRAGARARAGSWQELRPRSPGSPIDAQTKNFRGRVGGRFCNKKNR